MSRSSRVFVAAGAVLVWLGLTACVSTQHWSTSGGSRADGLVRVSYEYREFHEPTLSDAQAEQLAASRCSAWGYESAQPVAGQLRECSNRDGGNCDLWTVTREFQCRTQASSVAAARLSR